MHVIVNVHFTKFSDHVIADAIKSYSCELNKTLDCTDHADYLFSKFELTADQLLSIRNIPGAEGKVSILVWYFLHECFFRNFVFGVSDLYLWLYF